MEMLHLPYEVRSMNYDPIIALKLHVNLNQESFFLYQLVLIKFILQSSSKNHLVHIREFDFNKNSHFLSCYCYKTLYKLQGL